MNRLAVVLLLVAVAVVAHAKIDYEAAEKRFDECKNETKAEELFDDVIRNEKVPTSDKGMCLVECLFRRNNVYTLEGKFNEEGAKEYLSKVYTKKENFDKAFEISKACSMIDVEGLDKCEAAVKHVTCAKTKAVQANLNKDDD